MQPLFLLPVLGVLGLAFGSFANVVIWRFPRGESFISPGSRCPACGHAVRWYDNIPVISWIFLRARCRDCGEPISRRYPIVESLSAGAWVLAGLLYGLSWRTAVAAALFYLLIILSFIDIDTMRLPNPIVALLGGAGLFAAVVSQFFAVQLVPLTPVGGVLAAPLLAGAVGSLVSAGISLGIALLYQGVRGKAGFGMGDVKLLAAIGPFLGAYTVGVLFVASSIAALWGLAGALAGRKDWAARFPFGPFLAVATVIITAVGPDVWLWYLELVKVV